MSLKDSLDNKVWELLEDEDEEIWNNKDSKDLWNDDDWDDDISDTDDSNDDENWDDFDNFDE